MFFDTLFSLPLTVFGFVLGLFGLLLGSFLNVVIARLPIMIDREDRLALLQVTQQAIPDDLKGRYNLLTPASHCPKCKHKIRWWMNIPLLSFVLLKAKCAGCQAPIAWQYPAVEILAALAGVAAAFVFGAGPKAIVVAIFLWTLLTLTVIDFNTYLLPDALTLPLLWFGFWVNMQSFAFCTLEQAVWGAMVGYASLWLVYQLFLKLTGKQGMGYGDFKLFAALGAFLGIKLLLPIILFASISGAVIGSIMLATKKLSQGQQIPFGPYLACGGVLALFYGNDIVRHYLNYARFS